MVKATLEKRWPKPVLVLYRERHEQPDREPIAVIKARQLTVMRGEGDDEVTGSIADFFPLMGSLDVLADTSERYVLCWFDDDEDDIERSWRRLTSVTFPESATWTTNNRGKRTYRATFHVSRSAGR